MRPDVCWEVIVQPLIHLHPALSVVVMVCAHRYYALRLRRLKAGIKLCGLTNATMRALLMPVSSFSSRTAAVMGFSCPPPSIPPCTMQASTEQTCGMASTHIYM